MEGSPYGSLEELGGSKKGGWNPVTYLQYSEKKADEFKRDPHQWFRIPEDEISYKIQPKQFEGIQKIKEHGKTHSTYDKPVKDIIAHVLDNDHVMEFKHAEFSEDPQIKIDDKKLPNLTYEIDATQNVRFESLGSVSNLFHADITEVNEASFDKVGYDQAGKADFKIMGKDVSIQSEIDPRRTKSYEIYGHPNAAEDEDSGPAEKKRRVQITLTSLEWQSATAVNVPLSGNMFLLDTSSQKRISESYKFEAVDGKTKITVTVAQPHNDIALLLCLNKPFEGDLNSWIEAFYKGKWESIKSVGSYLQPLGWYPIFLFSDSVLGDSSEQLTREIWTDWFNRYDEDKFTDENISTTSQSRRAKDTIKKSKQSPVRMQLKITELPLADGISASTTGLDDYHSSIVTKVSEYQHCLRFLPTLANVSKMNAKVNNLSIKIQLASSDDVGDEKRFAKAIYGVKNELTSEIFTTISYHNKSPTFIDEFKIEMPLPLTGKHHLLFSFYHISFKNRREDACYGYAVQPLLENGFVVQNGAIKLAIFTELPDKYLAPDAALKYIDNGKPNFFGTLKLNTIFYTQSAKLDGFFKQMQSNPTDEDALTQKLVDLKDVDNANILHFWPVISMDLFRIICNSKTSATLQKKAFNTITDLLVKTHDGAISRNDIINDFVQLSYRPSEDFGKKLYHELCFVWNSCICEDDTFLKDMAKYSWFFMDVIVKDLLLMLDSKKALRGQIIKRGHVLAEDSYHTLQSLLDSLSIEVYRLAKTALNIGKTLNSSLASFHLRLISICKPDFILSNIWKHLTGFGSIIIHQNLKLDYLKLACSYEYAVQLSYPYPKPEQTASIAGSVNSVNFFPYIMQKSLVEFLRSPEEIRVRALQILHFVLGKFEMDSRYPEEKHKQRIFAMFLPTVALACQISVRLQMNENAADQLAQVELKHFSASLLCILRHIDHELLIKWLYANYNDRFDLFTDLLKYMTTAFKYQGKMSINRDAAKPAARGINDNAMKYIENSYKTGAAVGQGGNLRELRGTLRNATTKNAHKGTLKGTQRMSAIASEVSAAEEEALAVKLAGMEYHEAFLVAINITNSLFEISKSSKAKHSVPRVFGLLINFLDQPQSEISATICLKLMGKVIVEHYKIILKNNQLCSDACRVLLSYVASDFRGVKGLAAEIGYLLLKYNGEMYRGSIGKVKTQITVALSKEDQRSPLNLKTGLFLINNYAKTDAACTKTLSELIKSCTDTLVKILRDKVKMKLCREDSELYADMLYSLAAGYVNTPDLRLSILDVLANLHIENGYLSEAAFCKLHIAAISAEYLGYKKSTFGGPVSAKYFLACTKNIIEEKPISNDIDPDEEGICQSPVFTEVGLVQLLSQAANLFRQAQMFETAVEVHKIIIPVYEQQRNFERLVQHYTLIKELYESIVSTSGRRILATYFRVSFIGPKFNSLDGKEFIYKEKQVTQLSQVVQRLTDIYEKRFGGSFELINDASKLKNCTDKSKAYVYIAYVSPYFSADDLKKRPTYYERMHEVNEFVFETPFTMGNKAHGDVEGQYKRKTIVKTERPFSYITKRILITSTREIELTPIEVSIEAIAERCDKMKSAIEAKPFNLKNLQLLLQGSVRATVNKGPLEIAEVFLEREKAKAYKPMLVQELTARFEELAVLCRKGVELSKEHAPADQIEYNNDLMEGYEQFKQNLDTILKANNVDRRESKTTIDSAFEFLKGAQMSSEASAMLINKTGSTK